MSNCVLFHVVFVIIFFETMCNKTILCLVFVRSRIIRVIISVQSVYYLILIILYITKTLYNVVCCHPSSCFKLLSSHWSAHQGTVVRKHYMYPSICQKVSFFRTATARLFQFYRVFVLMLFFFNTRTLYFIPGQTVVRVKLFSVSSNIVWPFGHPCWMMFMQHF